MSDPQSAGAAKTGADNQIPLSELRLSLRASNQFLLDAVVFAKAGRDFTDNLILLAIVQANVALITADPQLQLKYAAADSPPPDALRRPISINAVAASLRLPFETVRRRIVHLAEQGVCVITPRGVIVPEQEVTSPDHLVILETNYQAVRDLYLRLRTAGCLPEPAVSRPPPPAPALRAVARVSSDFVLRLIDPVIAAVGSLSSGFTLLAVYDLNTRSLPDHERGDETPGAPGFVSDDRRRPATVRAVAERLGLPYEQTRRRLAAFLEQGRCSKVGEGYVLTSENLARTDMMDTYRSCHLALQRMFSSLAEIGVVTEWERDLPANAAT